MLVLNLKKGSQVSIGDSLLELTVIYDACAYVTYKGELYKVNKQVTKIDSSLEIIFKRRDKLSARIGLSSPYPIWRIRNDW